MHRLHVLSTLVALGALVGCGGIQPLESLAPVNGADSAAGNVSLSVTRGGFTLEVSPDTFLGAEPAGEFSLAATNDGDGVIATIEVSGANNLRALYCELGYDAAEYTPLSVEHLSMTEDAGARGDTGASDMLTLSVLDRPGTVHIGQVLAHWDERGGLRGNGQLARVRFARGPFSTDVIAGAAKRTVSSALSHSAVGPRLELSQTYRRLKWDYYYPGDYNQDGLVGVSDLTPLGAYLDEHGESLGRWYDEELEKYVPLGYSFPLDSLLFVIDGSGDGLITVSDITQIGQHFDEGVEAFNLYESADPERDIPATNGAPSTLEPLATVPFSTAQGLAGQERIWFSPMPPSPRNGFSYWVRPVKAEAEGTPSNAARYDMGLAYSFWLAIQPDTYLGGGTLEEARLEIKEAPEGLFVDVWVQDAASLFLFAGELHYDASRYSAKYGFIADLELAPVPPSTRKLFFKIHPPGILMVFTTPAQAYSGSGCIASVPFRREPEEESTEPRLVSPSPYDISMNLAYAEQAQTLSWYYCNQGDFNQDGGVWMDDLIQLGRFYGGTVPDFWTGFPEFYWGLIEFVVDANQDGHISVSDVTQIGLWAGASVDGYNVYMGTDPEAEPGPGPLGNVSLTEAEGDPFNERLRFSFHVDSPQPGQMLWVRPEFRGEVGEIPAGAVVVIP